MVRAMDRGIMAIQCNAEAAMTGVRQFSAQFLENAFDFMEMDIAGDGVGEQAMQHFAVAMIHDISLI